jgi:hypothetical protein
MKEDRVYALGHCSAYIAYVQSLYAERVGRPRVSVNSEILLHVHEPWHVPGDEVENLLQVYDLSFCVALNSVQYNKMACMFFWKLFLFNLLHVVFVYRILHPEEIRAPLSSLPPSVTAHKALK